MIFHLLKKLGMFRQRWTSFSGERQAEIDFRSEYLKNECIIHTLLKRINGCNFQIPLGEYASLGLTVTRLLKGELRKLTWHPAMLQNNSLQFASDVITTRIRKCCSLYYKMRRLDLLQNAAPKMRTLLQYGAIVSTNCVSCYKMRRYYKMPQNKAT